jgi:hypothetical protein
MDDVCDRPQTPLPIVAHGQRGSDPDLLKMKSLTKAGLAKKRVRDLADGILDIVTKAALGLI